MKKGFTLIELLAVIAILAIIMLIAAPKVLDTIESSKYKTLKTDKEMLVKATELYISNNVDQLPENIGDTVEVTLNQLETGSYISGISSPLNSNNCGGYVLVTKTQDENYVYSPQLNCVDNTKKSSITDALIGYWKLNNKSGILDLSGQGNHGTIIGDPVIGGDTDQTGNPNGAAVFDGGGDSIDLGNPDLLNFEPRVDAVTLVAWVKTLTRGAVFSVGTPGDIGLRQFYMFIDYVNITVDIGATRTSFGGVAINDGKWHQLVLTVPASTTGVKLAIDGETLGIVGNIGTTMSNYNAYIGARTDGTQFPYNGSISEIRLYNRVLTADEIKALYETTK